MQLTDKEKAILRKTKDRRLSKKSKKRVALFMRVSTYKQADKDDQVPIPIQKELLLEFVNQNPDWEFSGITYTEVNSAFKLTRKERERIAEAINDATNDKYDIILFFKHDRLSRISDEYTIILKDFWELGIEPWDYEKKQSLTIKTQMDKLVRFVEGWQGETESANTSFRVSKNMAEYAKQGMWLGGTCPYGFRYKQLTIETVVNSKKKRKVRMGIEKNPEEADMVKKIFELYINGYGSSKICSVLNNPPFNYRKRNGNLLDISMILNIIKNPIYTGFPTWGKTSTQNKFFERIDKKEWAISGVRIDDYVIISDEQWEMAQRCYKERSDQARKGKSFSRRSFSSNKILLGIVFCGYCGEPLLSKTYSDKKTNYHREGYMCRAFQRKGACFSRYGFWEKRQLEKIVINAVSKSFIELGAFDEEELFNRVSNMYQEGANKDKHEYQRIEKLIKQLKSQQSYYITEFNKTLIGEKTTIPETVISEQLFKIDLDLKEYEIAFNKIQNNHNLKPIEIAVLKPIVSQLKNWDTIFQRSETVKQKSMLQNIIDSVTVFDDYLEIDFNYTLMSVFESLNQSGKPLNLPLKEFKTKIQSKQTFQYTQRIKARNEGRRYWETVRLWEDKYDIKFGEIVANLRKDHSPEEIPEILGISKGFLYYHFGKYMDRIWYLEYHYGKSIKDIVLERREQNTPMSQIAEELGLSVSTLYNHLKK